MSIYLGRILAAVLLPTWLLIGVAHAQDAVSPAAPPAPPRATRTPSQRAVQIGPKDNTFPRKMRGKFQAVASFPTELEVATVYVSVDDKQVGRADAKPFSVEIDTATLADGQHTVKAVGKAASGREVWSASSVIDVVNSSSPTKLSPDGAPKPPSGVAPAGPRPQTPPQNGVGKTAPVAKPAAVAGLDRTYDSEEHGFSIRYPGDWTFKDQSVQVKPKTTGSCWVAFGKHPIEKASVIVNVRRARLEPGTDAAKFARYNSYVNKWQTKTVLGCPAFATVSHSGEGKKRSVIHRTIIIKDGYAWMLNCTDTSGKPESESAALFESMIQTLMPRTAK